MTTAEYHREYRKVHGARINEQKRHEKMRNPEKFKARLKLQYEVRMGRIKRGPCRVCGNPITQGHHENYSGPLNVIWFCLKHHTEHHKIERKQKLLAQGIVRHKSGYINPREYWRKQYARNRDKVAAWRKANPEKIKQYEINRKNKLSKLKSLSK